MGFRNEDKPKPQQPVDILSQIDKVTDSFGKIQTNESSRQMQFNPSDYEFMSNINPYDNPQSLNKLNVSNQTLGGKYWRTGLQFGANVVASLGQGLANTFDLIATGNTIKGETTGSNDNFESSFMGLTTGQMRDWAETIAKNNPVLEKNPGEFAPGDSGWWFNQIAQAGTGVGMAIEAAATTAAIEYSTGGLGTGAALTKIGQLFSKVKKGAQGAELLNEALVAAKGMRSAATLYGTISRYSESRMEAMNDYKEIYDNLSQEKDTSGNEKYTEADKKKFASEGARRDFNINLALLPLDILSYRTMVFNPISGTAEGLLEKGLAKIAGVYGKSKLGKTAGWLTEKAIGANIEGLEEGFQNIGEKEGQHYARVLGGLDDGKSFATRLGENVSSDEFWNNYAGGVIGSPVIGGLMNAHNKFANKTKNKEIAEIHKNFISQVGVMDNAIANKIQKYEAAGDSKTASILRRQFNANKILSGLHLDAMTDRDTAYDSRITFIQGVLGELNEGKTDALKDLGFSATTPEQLAVVKQEFSTYLDDAKIMKDIYDNVKQKYNRNFVPEITQQHFQLHSLIQEEGSVNEAIAAAKLKLMNYSQLSTQGKELHDIEYSLNGLKYEQARLSKEYKDTEDAHEKVNVNQLIEENKAKIIKAASRIKEISSDSTYDTDVKSKDAEILDSSILHREYGQAIYDKEHLENEISLQRKNLALWNKPEYQSNKLKEAVSKAQTSQQVSDIKDNATPEQTDVVKEAENKQIELDVQNLSESVAPIDTNGTQQVGNANLFEVDESLIADITEVTGTNDKTTEFEDSKLKGEPEFLFSPTNFDFSKSSDEVKRKLQDSVKALLGRIGENPTFEQLLRHIISVKGVNATENIFNALKYGWEANGNPVADYDAIYQNVFGNPLDQIFELASQLQIQNSEQLEEATTKVTDDVIAKQNQPQGYDNNNQPNYRYNGIITNEASPKLAFTTRLSQVIQQFDEEGNIVVSNEYTEEELNAGDYVNSLQLLDPDQYLEGTEMDIKRPSNFMDIKIPVFKADGTKGQAMTFGQYVASKQLDPTSQEYKDKLPMIIYRKGAPANEKGLAFVHDIGWYHPLRFNQEFQGDMLQAIAQTRAIRDEVIENGGHALMTITGKRQTTFAGLKLDKGKEITLKEANPDTQLTVALTDDSLSTSKKNIAYPNNQTAIINQTPFSVGQIIDVRRYGMKDGVKTYIALPVLRDKLDDAAKASIIKAINIYGTRGTTDAKAKADNEKVVSSIKQTMGLDITTEAGLRNYLNHFISIFNTEKAKSNLDVEQQAKAKLAPGTPFISIIAGGNIVFGITGQTLYVDKNSNKVNSLFINPNSTTLNPLTLTTLSKPNILGWYEQNLNLDNLNIDKPIVLADNNNNTTIAYPSYRDMLLSKLKTNIRSYNIGTQEKPNYVTNVQPVITYDTNKRLNKLVETPTITEVAQEVVQPTEKIVEEQSEEQKTAAKLAQEFIQKAQNKLGDNFGLELDTNQFSPTVLTKEQREEITKNLERIAELTPNQQFQVVNFIYNQIVPTIDANNGIVAKKEITRIVKETVSKIFQPLIDENTANILHGEKLLEQFPDLANTSQMLDSIRGYQVEVEKAKSILSNIDVFESLAEDEVKKYTQIEETSVRLTELEDEEIEGGDEVKRNARERDFWTDVLRENPQHKATYKMRRFFGQIRSYDKAGKTMTGFLRLPLYMDSDKVIRTLMVTLADVPSSFYEMIKKLEDRKAALPWIQEVIDKLKVSNQQMKNTFVTVMSNTPLRMKFTMISYNRRNGTWTTKVWNTNLNGVADSIKNQWRSNFIDSGLVTIDVDSNYQLNKTRAQYILDIFDSWKGKSLVQLSNPEQLREDVVGRVKKDKAVMVSSKGAMLQELKTHVVGVNDRMTFSLANQNYQITTLGNDKYRVSLLQTNSATDEDVQKWLDAFGITLSPASFAELKKDGLFHNYQQIKYDNLFQTGSDTNGLFGILANSLRNLLTKEEVDFTENGDSPLDNSVISSLANLESKYNDDVTPFGFRDNKKSFFALTAGKYITDRTRDLKDKDSNIRSALSQISFSKQSLWLRLLEDDDFKAKFQVFHMGDTAFKELGKKLYKDNSLGKLSDADHELVKLGMFWDTLQGAVSYNTLDARGNVVTLKTYPDSDIALKMATMFTPTMSDKHIMTVLTTAVLNLQNGDLNNGEGISKQVGKALYEQTVKPELQRMIKFWQNGGKTNILQYDKGAGLFFLMPEMNNVEFAPGVKLIDVIKHNPNKYTLQQIEANTSLMDSIHTTLKNYVDSLTSEKVQVWKNNGYLIEGEEGITEIKFFDNKYLSKFNGSKEQVSKMAAMDFVVNSLIANANSFMLYAGDPAMYYKSKRVSPFDVVEDSFVNIGKRLANQIAPGTKLAESETEKYLQVFLEDRVSTAGNIEYLREILGEEGAKAYTQIEGSDAQEYTTWKEHLDILTKLGKTADAISDISPQEITEARQLFASGVSKNQLTEKQQQLLGKVMQPIKPVYTGQIYDKAQDVMRTIYIKSSSFPLIPQLTAGFEIDKLRIAMEQLEKQSKMNVRASYQTANKVGAISNPAKVWLDNGNINEAATLSESSLILERKNFRIQQDIPFKSGKTGEDKITLGTQLMKLLFGDEMMNYTGFSYNGKDDYTGKELHKIYNDLFINLVKEKKNQLYTELGLDANGLPVDIDKAMEKLQAILKDEAKKRDYPLQDIEGLTIKDGQFVLPLWASSNSNRYESMLNSIVTNRVIRMKFSGNSYVVGSEEGFKMQEELEGVDKSGIIWTSAWNGKELEAAYHDEAKTKIKKAQVLVASKFKDDKGNLIDLFTKEGTEYKYITKTEQGFRLKEDMFDKDLLTLMSFRIPTSGHQSASQIEIAGFIPFESADLMIVPKNFTKQKGLDFDVDKENTYQLNHIIGENGKIEVLIEKHRTQYIALADRLKENANDETVNKLMNSVFGEGVYTKEDLEEDKLLAKASSKFDEKLSQNEIVKIHHSVFSNPKVQGKIAKTLNTDFAEEQAELIEGLTNTNKDKKYWTALSDEYQKQKMMSGASGKVGTGAYSVDVVFHSLAQQIAMSGKPIILSRAYYSPLDGGEKPSFTGITWRFGSTETKGILGGTITLDGGRSISEVMSERQNIAIDNEKLQVMGRVGLNELTMDVDKVLNMLGFDKGEDGNSISFLFLSQPIIKEYVDMMRNANSTMADFDLDKEANIVHKLLTKYKAEDDNIDVDYWELMSSKMDNKSLIESIKSTEPDKQLQAAVLRRFIEIKKYGEILRSIQTAINTDSKGLGKSFFEVIEKRAALSRLANSSILKDGDIVTGAIDGASNLIGDYAEMPTTEAEYLDLMSKGYIDLGTIIVKPTTLSGAFSLIGVNSAYQLWAKHFPYDAAVTNKAFEEVMRIIGGGGDVTSSKSIDTKQEVFKHIKKYFSASKQNGIIDSQDDINAERQRIFIDSDTNTSLAKYLKTIRNLVNNSSDPKVRKQIEAVNAFIKTNKLINRFEYEIEKNGQPSLIKFNNAAGEEFDEQYLYEGLTTLMEVRGKNGSIELPIVGNKSYTLDTLAQDLIAYTHLGNSTQEAIQFTKYVPVSYLTTIGYSEKMRMASEWLKTNPNILGMTLGTEKNEEHLVSEFTMQYIQHNPERVNTPYKNSKVLMANIIEGNSRKLSNLTKFKLKVNDNTRTNPAFISVYNPELPKSEKKFQLYWTSDGVNYSRVPVLGTFGMDEYQPRNSIGSTLVNPRASGTISPSKSVESLVAKSNDVFEINSGDIMTVVNNIAEHGISGLSDLAKQLLPFVKGATKISYSEDVEGVTTFEGYYHNGDIYINSKYVDINDPSAVAQTVLHELVHSITNANIHKYIKANDLNDVQVDTGAPAYVSEMIRLYNSLRELSNKDELKDILTRVRNQKGITVEERDQKYGLTNIDEFMAMALTSPEFQKYLAKTEFKQSGKTFLERFKEVIGAILSSLGVNFDSETATVHAINSIFQFIEGSNATEQSDKSFEEMQGKQADEDKRMSDFLNRMDREISGDAEELLNPTVFPSEDLTIQDENCI